MDTFKSEGNVLEYTAPAGGVTSGVPVVIGDVTVIPAVTVAVGVKFNGAAEGIYEVPKTNPEVWAEGETLYWDGGTGKMTNVAGALKKAGVVADAALSAATVGNCKLER
jgi:predicted RecA/RadA family phage recombinase